MTHDRLAIDMSTSLAVNPGLVLRVEDDDCALLFDPDSGKVQMLNGTAVDIWQLLDGKRTLKDIVSCLHEIYEDMDDDAEQQVLGLVQTLSKLGAVGVWETPP